MLSIVSTPIGNLEDITLRALRTLKECDFIACEDTRTSGIMLKHYEISKPLLSFHSHSNDFKIAKILSLLKEGKHIALISDAGTPWISDPWFVLIRQALEQGIDIVPIPWVSACITALSASGLDTHHFVYLGFLPIKKGRQTLLKTLKDREETIVLYESVHRIEKTLCDLETYLGSERKIVVGRELTKKFETFHRGTIEEVKTFFKTNPDKIKWEFVVLL